MDDPEDQRRDALLAAFMDRWDSIVSPSFGGPFGNWLIKSHLGCLVFPVVVVSMFRGKAEPYEAHGHVVRLYHELSGKDRFASEADVYRIEWKLVLLRASEPVTEDGADEAPETERAELELAAAALLDLALQGGRADDELMLEIQAAFEALDEAIEAQMPAAPGWRWRRAARDPEDDATRAALEQRYWLAWRRWFERHPATPG